MKFSQLFSVFVDLFPFENLRKLHSQFEITLRIKTQSASQKKTVWSNKITHRIIYIFYTMRKITHIIIVLFWRKITVFRCSISLQKCTQLYTGYNCIQYYFFSILDVWAFYGLITISNVLHDCMQNVCRFLFRASHTTMDLKPHTNFYFE